MIGTFSKRRPSWIPRVRFGTFDFLIVKKNIGQKVIKIKRKIFIWKRESNKGNYYFFFILKTGMFQFLKHLPVNIG